MRFTASLIVGIVVTALALAQPVAANDEPCPALPDNDNFDNAQVIEDPTGWSWYCPGTLEPGEPAAASQAPYGSVWFRWTASRAAFQSFGVPGNTKVEVFAGTTLDKLRAVASSLPHLGKPVGYSYADLWTQAGSTYFIRVLPEGRGRLIWRPGTDYPQASADFDGDGCEDLAVGVPGERLKGLRRAGAVVVRYGCGGRTERWHQDNDGAIRTANEAGDRFGAALAAGVFDHASHRSTSNAIDDLAIGVPGEDIAGEADAGMVVVLRGEKGVGLTTNKPWRVTQDARSGPVSNDEAGDRFGAALAAVPYVRYDVDDYVLLLESNLLVGVPGEDYDGKRNAGYVALAPRGSGADSRSALSGGTHPVLRNQAQLGLAIAAGGLRYGEDHRIWVAGEPGARLGAARAANAGGVLASIRFPYSCLDNSCKPWRETTLGISPRRGDRLGAALTVADLQDDKKPEVIAGAPGRDVNGKRNAGMVVAYELDSGESSSFTEATPGVPGRPQVDDRFGSALTSGFFNRDTREDILIGAPGQDVNGQRNAGAVTVAYGMGPFQTLHLDTPNMVERAREGDRFGSAVGGLDLNGDTLDEMVIGAPWDDIKGVQDAGSVFVRFRTNKVVTRQHGAGLSPGRAEPADNFGAAVLP